MGTRTDCNIAPAVTLSSSLHFAHNHRTSENSFALIIVYFIHTIHMRYTAHCTLHTAHCNVYFALRCTEVGVHFSSPHTGGSARRTVRVGNVF